MHHTPKEKAKKILRGKWTKKFGKYQNDDIQNNLVLSTELIT